MTDNSERSQIPTTSNPVDTAMIGELKRLSGDHRGYLGDQLGNAALRMQGLIEEIEQLKDETDGLRAAARHARKMRDAEIERLTRERDEACNKLSALHEGAGFSDETSDDPEEQHSRRVQFEKYHAMSEFLMEFEYYAKRAADILAGRFPEKADAPQNMEAHCQACKRNFVTSWVSLRTKAAKCPICSGVLTAPNGKGDV